MDKKQHRIYKEGSKVYGEGFSDGDGKVVIPSQKFPLSGPLKVYYSDNTEKCDDPLLLTVYDSVQPKVGQCFTNAETLVAAFKAAGIEKQGHTVEIHVGWMFITDLFPYLHCYTVVDDKYVFDFACDWRTNTVELFSNIQDKAGFAEVVRQRQQLKNTERFDPVGKVDPFYVYVGAHGKPSEGRKLFEKLKRAYPNHPSFRGPIGELTETQKLIVNSKGG